MHQWEIEWPQDYAERREIETPDKGWLDVVVRFADGRCYALAFYDRVRLEQTVASAIEADGIFVQPGLVVIDEVNTETVKSTVAGLVESGTLSEFRSTKVNGSSLSICACGDYFSGECENCATARR